MSDKIAEVIKNCQMDSSGYISKRKVVEDLIDYFKSEDSEFNEQQFRSLTQ